MKCMAKEAFKIPYPNTPAGKSRWNKQFGLNAYYSGKPWQLRRKDAEFWHNVTKACMQNAGVRKRPFEKPVNITMYFNDRLDCSNHAMYFKMIEDGLKGRLIQDDSKRWVKSCTMAFHEEDYILVVVEEVKYENKP